MRFQFRADFLNATNHPNFAAPNTSLGTGMGISGTTQGNLAGERNLQFALKFFF
jgi:hypothetical protein